MFRSFGDLPIPNSLALALERMNFCQPTPIQSAAIPAALDGRDILGSAQTGTGKTAAFAVPLLSHIYTRPGKTGLVLSPTRELAAQIHAVFRKMSADLRLRGSLVVGGESFSRQAREIEQGVDYIIATPGRLNDHLQEGTMRLSQVSFLVLDEVDRMLDMGFAPQIKQVMHYVPQQRQTLLFSATLPNESVRLANTLLRSPMRIAVAAENRPSTIEVKTIHTSTQEKSQTIVSQLKEYPGKVLIFTRTQSRTEKIARVLEKSGHRVVSLHGGRTQGQRKRALNEFRSGNHPVMVATDVAGRGIDVSDIDTVINFDLPSNHDDYIHRIGRTGRNGKSGIAVNFITPEDTDVALVLTGKKENKPRRPQPHPRSMRPGRRRFGKFSGSHAR